MRCFRTLAFILLLSSAALAQLTPSDLDAYVERARKVFDTPGIAVAIVKDGRLVFAKGYGVKKLGDPAPVTENTLFGIGSNTKAFSAATIATLVDEGKLSWDDKVSEKLPGFAMYDPYASHEMTVRDLLCHRSGLGLGEGDMLLWPRTTYTRAEIVQRIRYMKPAYSFRSKYAYSNLMFITAGELTAAVTGKSWEESVRERIFQPLGMNSSNFSNADLKPGADFAWPHSRNESKMTVDAMENKDTISSAGAINSSVSDLAKWMMAQLNQGKLPNGDKRLFSEKQWQEMWSPQTIVPTENSTGPLAALNTDFSAYGLGWGLREYHGHKLVGHSGGLMGFLTRVLMVPDQNLGVVVLTNTDTSDGPMNAIAYHIVDSYLGITGNDWIAAWKSADEKSQHDADETMKKAATERVASSGPSLPLAKYAGAYRDAWYGPATIAMKDGKLTFTLDRSQNATGELTPWQHDTFKLHWALEDAYVTFALNPDGTIHHFTMLPVSPLADFSYDYQDLYFTPGK
ncbi:beta-lactamase [Candidatus Koribacter versatilis Ellin345]|uniref:Beta-lactamase n=1 Tax=Koribacter versatilis (strain Ellin345) TaxID=204669 RepID=Q1ILK2_KORVE|nr:serine hydrolase [Candidatus Koribacter versatilis]ABF42248.1 beta-lactamase [Candidatus Koribacter versatilis Ellin345]